MKFSIFIQCLLWCKHLFIDIGISFALFIKKLSRDFIIYAFLNFFDRVVNLDPGNYFKFVVKFIVNVPNLLIELLGVVSVINHRRIKSYWVIIDVHIFYVCQWMVIYLWNFAYFLFDFIILLPNLFNFLHVPIILLCNYLIKLAHFIINHKTRSLFLLNTFLLFTWWRRFLFLYWNLFLNN
jgi:hypothetical protein